ncbi:arrestin (or s-antigen) n-terminal domain protein [Diplodia corticola]|uniref:Arrestin (Or s-antigen) n-terminal domain protein n=1 Tax=Diplodia corticola TaxID=236234 RepID=A0A1J9SFG8_9PEZI|nr:arrestin (or s-antigen) n-terminal domain protein [Diplodia corticola]OJD38564.1 arrestin (or s-antigen) n-terminal domain protein [Diplodia corticola]
MASSADGLNVVDVAIHVNTAGSDGNHGGFASGDEITGEVVVTTPEDVHVRKVDVFFTGRSQTCIDSIIAPGPVSTKKRFLKLRRRVRTFTSNPDGSWPIPFSFLVPHALDPAACSCVSLPDDHLQLPPTMGGNHSWEHAGQLLDDPTPDMVDICYKIVARVEVSDSQGRCACTETHTKLCVVPSFPEPPPSFSSEYRIREEKGVRRSILTGRLGCLVMEAQTPSALKGIKSDGATLVSTKVLVRFDPASHDCAPPAPEDIMRKIQATSTWKIGPKGTSSNGQTTYAMTRAYTEAISLPPFHLAGAKWLKRSPGWEHMQVSNGHAAPADLIAPSSGYIGGVYYLLKLAIPVELPPGKVLVPTFHSCLVSRTYELEVALLLSSAASITVRVPLHICT